MSLNSVASSNRIHISFLGMRNAGKSSVVNAVTNQSLSVVSKIKGTTTDPVRKSMELLPLGPVVIIDTPGFDDEGELGTLRVEKAKDILNETDIAVLVVDAVIGLCESDREFIKTLQEKNIPYVIAYNKLDLLDEEPELKDNEICVSAWKNLYITELKEKIGDFAKKLTSNKKLVSDLLAPGDFVVLVIPIDEAAPKGRLILPQQMVIRDILDAHGSVMSCQPQELKAALQMLSVKPKLVITDSQVFGVVSRDTPADIWLTSFSILMARYKGELDVFLEGTRALSTLKDDDKVLIAESCSHHRQCNDIGTVKIPRWVETFTKARLQYSFTSGGEFPSRLEDFKLIIHCGGCMINETAMKNRIEMARLAGVPIVNYGMAIAQMHGILARSMEPFL